MKAAEMERVGERRITESITSMEGKVKRYR